MTTGVGPTEVQRCLDAGMDGWLTKPVTRGHLHDLLMHWLAVPDFISGALTCEQTPSWVELGLPTRATMIATFGSWDVVTNLLSCLVQEAREDMQGLAVACAKSDALLVTQRLHRLVGGVVFLGPTRFERQGVQLIDQVLASGVTANRPALEAFQREVEEHVRYLTRLIQR